MAKILVIPDTHTRDFWKEAKNLIDNYEKVIFLGDYVDPYPFEFNLSKHELRQKTISDFEEIIDFAKQYQDKVILLLGNHDLHYIDPRYKCWRFDYEIANDLAQIHKDYTSLFHTSYQIDDVLFTHAGVCKEWIDYICQKYNKTYSNNPVEFINNCSFQQLMMCGPDRGGNDLYSGPEWHDVHEFDYTTPLEGFYQVFGHTQVLHLKKPYERSEVFACVDTQTIYEFDTLTHELKCLQEYPKCKYW